MYTLASLVTKEELETVSHGKMQSSSDVQSGEAGEAKPPLSLSKDGKIKV